MSNTNLSRVSLVLMLVLISGCVSADATVDQPARTAAVLLSEYETVFYTNTDLSSRLSSFKGLSRQSAATLSIPFGYLIGALDSADPHASEEILSRTDSIMMGAKNFIPPQGEGGTQLTDFCYVASFGARGMPDLHKYFTSASVATLNGAPVWKWSGNIYDDGQHQVDMYAAQIDRARLAFASSIDQLRTLATKVSSTTDADAALSKLPEWPAISRREYWGYRQIQYNGEMQSDSAHLEAMMPGAQTVIMFADLKAKTVTLRVLGADAQEYSELTKRQKEQQRAAMARMGMHPPLDNYADFRASGPRALEKEFSLASPQAEGEVLIAAALMGFELII